LARVNAPANNDKIPAIMLHLHSPFDNSCYHSLSPAQGWSVVIIRQCALLRGA
jgi:hypothetical protein